jgi:uncharacterized cupin superfamily protein
MDAMCDVTRATAAQQAAATARWQVWESATHDMDAESRFPFDYGTNFEEHVVVVSGEATLTPDDGSPTLTIRTGDYVVFHQGFACQWQIIEPVTKMYCYFDAEGNETQSNSVGCDLCSEDCSAESYLMDGEVDLCPACFTAKGCDYHRAERCHGGKEVGDVPIHKKVPAKAAKGKRKAVGEGDAAKKKKATGATC